jgi:hypothetical protein
VLVGKVGFLVWCVVVGAACGRIGFDPLGAGVGDAANDAAVAISLIGVAAPGYQSQPSVTATVDQIAGDFALAAVYWDEDPDTVTLGDTLGLSWTSLVGETIGSGCGDTTGNGTGARLWYAPITATGQNAITVTQDAGAHPLGEFVLEYRGISASDPIDTTAMAIAPASTNTLDVPTLTTTATDELVVFWNDTIGSGTMVGTPGFTIEAHDDAFPNTLEDEMVPPGSYAPTGQLPAGHMDACWVGLAVALRGG